MRLKGEKIKNDNIQIVVIPRKDNDLAFYFKPVLNIADFESLVPRPEPPVITYANGTKKHDTDDKDFRDKFLNYILLQDAWMFLQSISATPELEWETVNLNDSATWMGYVKELQEAEFTDKEVEYLKEAFNKANAFDEDQMEAARNRFLASLTQQDQ